MTNKTCTINKVLENGMLRLPYFELTCIKVSCGVGQWCFFLLTNVLSHAFSIKACQYKTLLVDHISGPWFNIKMSSYQYRKSHCGDKTVVRSSYLHNGISYTGKMTSLYWFGPLVSILYIMQLYLRIPYEVQAYVLHCKIIATHPMFYHAECYRTKLHSIILYYDMTVVTCPETGGSALCIFHTLFQINVLNKNNFYSITNHSYGFSHPTIEHKERQTGVCPVMISFLTVQQYGVYCLSHSCKWRKWRTNTFE